MMRKFRTVGLAGLTLALVAACGGGTAGGGNGSEGSGSGSGSEAGSGSGSENVEITLTWWGNDDRADKYNAALELFHEDHPEIKVLPNWQAFSDYWTARNTEAAGSALPDVMQFDTTFLREYASSGRLLDFGPYVEDGTIDLSGVDPTLVDSVRLDGELLAIPTATNTLGMFVNPTVLDLVGLDFPEAGYTWQEYNDYLEAVAAAGVTTEDGYEVYGGSYYSGTFWFFLQWLVQKGVEPFTPDGGIAFTEQDILDWFALTDDLREAGVFFPAERTTALAPLGGFTMNEVVSESSWDNFLAGYVADSGVEDIALVPIWSGPDGTSNFFRSFILTAGANSDHPEAAATLVNFLLTDPRVGEIFGTSKGIPADEAQREAVVAEPGSVDATVLDYEEAILAAGGTQPAPIPVRGFGAVEEKWKQLSEEVAYGSLTPEQLAQEWFAEADLVVSE